VWFSRGIGHTDDPRLLQWFKEHGYWVENDFDTYSVDDLRVYAKEHRINLTAAKKRESILRIIEEHIHGKST
jgi:hypothetical protein